jgi:hypothetical protein
MNRESIYWIIVLMTFIYIVFKNKNSLIKILIILCFYSGLASFYGKTIENYYKILVVLLALYLLQKNNALSGLKKKTKFFFFSFSLFSISFIYSAIINDDYFTLVFSQYGKYVTPICLFFVLNSLLIKSPAIFINLKNLFFSLLTIQILLSAFKIPTIGLQESTVGSILYIGGGAATMLPVLGFILIWVHKGGDIERTDWYYIFLLLLIGFASLKRSIWFIMPIIIFLFMYYVPRKVKFSNLLYFIPVIPFIFYIGIRLNPTLNKEGKIGGSFDLQYSMDYVQKYNFGKTSETTEIQTGQGRGGATFLLLNKLVSKEIFSSNDYWGYGLREIYTTDYEQFDDKKFGVNSKGAVTGIFQSYISSGFIGVFISILFIISILALIKEPRIRISIALIMFWDYLFYIGLILRIPSLFVLLLYIIIYSNFQFEQKLYKKYLTHKSDDKNRNIQPQAV